MTYLRYIFPPYRLRALTCLVFALVLATVAPTLAQTPRVDARANVLRLGLNVSGFNTRDPHYAASFADRILADLVFNGLIRFTPGQAPNLEPDLAENIPEPQIINGKQTWTFFLKKGIYFQGEGPLRRREVTSEAVLRSFKKTMDPRRSAYAGGYQGIFIQALDRYTVRFTVDPPQSPLLFLPKVADYAGGFITAEVHDPREPESPRLLGTGPFKILGQFDDRFVLTAHDHYFRGRPQLDGIEIFFVPRPADRLPAFRDYLDLMAGESNEGWVNRVMALDHARVNILGVQETATLHFNTRKPPFSDIRVRKAVAYALDREGFVHPFGETMAQSIFSPVPPYMPGGLSRDNVKAMGLDYPTNLDKARKLLADAGYPKGFRITTVASELDQYLKNARTLEAQLARVGIQLDLVLAGHARMHKLIRSQDYPLVLYEAFRPNTDEILSRFFHSESSVITGRAPATNFSHYDGIDALIEKARGERITLNQIKLWEYAQIKLLEDMVVYPLHFRQQAFARKDYLELGHPVTAAMALYPQITEKTRLILPRPGTGERP